MSSGDKLGAIAILSIIGLICFTIGVMGYNWHEFHTKCVRYEVVMTSNGSTLTCTERTP